MNIIVRLHNEHQHVSASSKSKQSRSNIVAIRVLSAPACVDAACVDGVLPLERAR